MLKVILFDIDNTLLSFDEYVKESMKIGFEKFGIGKYEDYMFSVFTNINSSLWRSIENGELSFEELQKIRWNKIFEHLGISADGVAFEKYFQECLCESAIPINGASELLESLSGKYTLGVASNGPYFQQVNRLRICGMLHYFSHLFISEEIGSSKPSSEFFNTCIDRLNSKADKIIKPCEIMIIGDSLSSDMAGGIRCGMKTCFYNPHSKPVPRELKLNYTVTSLKEIANIL
ncbi:MAG: YjjG family noncanonical pyrimidine nucleotidase [Clostridia bacterium]|nr:YjjG family noncanonical pyrimidine nucleotidase [Clostridia bacterium]